MMSSASVANKPDKLSFNPKRSACAVTAIVLMAGEKNCEDVGMNVDMGALCAPIGFLDSKGLYLLHWGKSDFLTFKITILLAVLIKQKTVALINQATAKVESDVFVKVLIVGFD